jgi:hypothetical protein
MINKALEKLEAELQKNIDNRTMIRVGDYVKEQIEKSETNSEKFLDEKKSLSGAIDKMRTEAKKAAVGGVGCLTDEEGLEIVHSYFGFEIYYISTSSASGVNVDLLDLL